MKKSVDVPHKNSNKIARVHTCDGSHVLYDSLTHTRGGLKVIATSIRRTVEAFERDYAL